MWEQARALLGDAAHRRGRRVRRDRPLDAASLPPIVSWGTSPQDVATIDGFVPRIEDGASESKRASIKRSLEYMGFHGGEKISDLALDRVFIGSCTNGRIEDLRAAAKVVEGRRKVAERVNAMVVPGSGLVKEQAEAEGLDKVFLAAGFEWREPGCSMCLAMNPDKLSPGRALRLDLEPQFRGPPGLQGPHASGVAHNGGGGGHRGPVRGRENLGRVTLG